MIRSIFCRHLCLVLLTLFAVSAVAADTAKPKPKKKAEKAEKAAKAEKAEKKPAEPAPKIETLTVKKKPFRIVVELDGVFEAENAKEISVTPEAWPKLTVLKAAEHGQHVRKGDVILELETEKLDLAIADLRDDLKLSGLAIKLAEENLGSLEKTTPLDLESSRRAAKIAEEDKRFFFEVAKPFSLKAVDFGLKVAREQLEYQQEEYDQLEKMYKADDITEETEAIVLKRARIRWIRRSSRSNAPGSITTSP